MSIIAIMDVPTMSQDRYDRIMKDLDAAGASTPGGRTYHCMSLKAQGCQVVDIWDSEEQLAAFFETLGPILSKNDVKAPTPVLSTVYNIVRPGR